MTFDQTSGTPQTSAEESISTTIRPKPSILVDFDGVLHSYTSPWTKAWHIPDGPVEGAMPWLRWMVDHFKVHIFSTRSSSPLGLAAMRSWVLKHLQEEFGPDVGMDIFFRLSFPQEKPPVILSIDDRGFCFDGDFSILTPDFILGFKPWNRRPQ